MTRELYIELLIEYCNTDKSKAEVIVDNALEKQRMKKDGDVLRDLHTQ